MLRSRFGSCEERQVHIGARRRRKLLFRLLRLLADTLQRHFILIYVNALGTPEFFSKIAHKPLVEIIAAEMIVAGGRKHFYYFIAYLYHGNVKGSAA